MLRYCSLPTMSHMSGVWCQVSGARCHVSRVTCHMSSVIFIFFNLIFFYKGVKPVGGGPVIKAAYPI